MEKDATKHNMRRFSEWLQQQFLKWERRQPRKQTYSAFARYLGVNHSSLSQWRAGYPASMNNLRKIAAVLGPEVFDAAGVERPPDADPNLAYIISGWDRLDQGARQLIVQIVRIRLCE